jgi:uncharacterized protein
MHTVIPHDLCELGRVAWRACLAAAVLGLDCGHATADVPTPPDSCLVGTYHLRDGTDVDIGQGRDAHLRWRRIDGTTGELTKGADGTWTSTLGWTLRPDGKRVAFAGCGRNRITFAGTPGKRIALRSTETKFHGDGVTLAGRLVMPPGEARVPLVILVHGSENSAALDSYPQQRLFPSQGIGAFVYDKRGTGGSSGDYTQDYTLLAKDALAAMREARRLAGTRAGRVGYQGTSQGGWVAPLAASYAPVDFVIVGYGLAVSPLEEDRSAIALDMTRRGYGPEIVAKSMEVADASAAILMSGFTQGYDRLDAVRAKYGTEPWFKYVHGDISFVLLQMPHDEARVQLSNMIAGIRPEYDPMPVLRSLRTPQLWILAADDLEAPSAETLRRLKALAQDGAPIVTAVFPHTEHGIYEYEETPLPEAERTDTRNPDGYLAMMCDYMRFGRLKTRYGSSEVFAAEH